ncbi:MAG: hypothetical protein PHJ00_07795 [Candidatus Omnitrophica bacterium]|nr:hypothetical protein [Candidatus Omnitrophota bacterium]
MPIILPFAVIAIVIIIVITASKGQRDALGKLANHLPGAVKKWSVVPTFSGDYQGLKFFIAISPGGENSPPQLQISFDKKPSFRLSIYKENILTLWAEKIGLVREVKTGDTAFDGEFLIFSNKAQQALMYLSNAAYKENIRKIFNYGFSSFTAGGQKVVIQKSYSSDFDLEPNKVLDILRVLSSLTRGL